MWVENYIILLSKVYNFRSIYPKMELFLEWPNQHKNVKIAEKLLKFWCSISGKTSCSDILPENLEQISLFDYKFEKNKWKEFTVDSIDPGWELNLGHLFRYHTSRPLGFL